MAPPGGRTIAATVGPMDGTTPQMNAYAGATAVFVAEAVAQAVEEVVALEAVEAAAFVVVGAGCLPLAWTRMAAPSKVTSTDPSRSVR